MQNDAKKAHENIDKQNVDSGRRSLEAEAASTAPKVKPPKDADDLAAFNQGRTARLGGISKDEAPHAEKSDALKAWTKGWESLGD